MGLRRRKRQLGVGRGELESPRATIGPGVR